MEPHDITVDILKSIRDEVRQTNSRLDQTNSRLDQTNSRLKSMHGDLSARIEAMHEELSTRIVESEVRTATAITELAGSVREMTGVLKASVELRPRVERCEQDIAEIRAELATR
jgi:predicted  nucleic acid-binding Zn-ribbon protein